MWRTSNPYIIGRSIGTNLLNPEAIYVPTSENIIGNLFEIDGINTKNNANTINIILSINFRKTLFEFIISVSDTLLYYQMIFIYLIAIIVILIENLLDFFFNIFNANRFYHKTNITIQTSNYIETYEKQGRKKKGLFCCITEFMKEINKHSFAGT